MECLQHRHGSQQPEAGTSQVPIRGPEDTADHPAASAQKEALTQAIARTEAEWGEPVHRDTPRDPMCTWLSPQKRKQSGGRQRQAGDLVFHGVRAPGTGGKNVPYMGSEHA